MTDLVTYDTDANDNRCWRAWPLGSGMVTKELYGFVYYTRQWRLIIVFKGDTVNGNISTTFKSWLC